MDFSGMIMGVSGARGIVGETLTPEVACRLASSFGHERGGSILVARDSRPSGAAIAQAVCAGLASVGCAPVVAGICTTPGAQIGVEDLGLAGGIMITASHNPAPWNGLKFIGGDGAFITAEEADGVFARARAGGMVLRGWDGWPAPADAPDITVLQIRRIVNSPLVDVSAIRRRGFRLVVDCNHGASGPLIRAMASLMDLEIHVLGEEPTGRFCHTPEPSPEHLGALREAVREDQADLGAAIDPDGDRLALCTTDGLLPEEATLACVAAALLRPNDAPVVTNLSTSRMVEDVAGRFGVPVIRTPVGEAHVVSAMKAFGATLGGEGNGGVIIPGVHYGRDAAAGLAVLLSHLAQRGQTLAGLWNQIPRYVMIKRKVRVAPETWDTFPGRLEREFRDFTVDTQDGVRLNWPARWVHVRRSNTEPVVRIIAEGSAGGELMSIIETIERMLVGGGALPCAGL